MAESSTSISYKINKLLTKIDIKDVLLTFGFVKENCSLGIPSEIINYCVVYGFLKINQWFKGGTNWTINESKYIATEIASGEGRYSTIYGKNLISEGKHEWKVKIIEPDLTQTMSSMMIGIASSMHQVNSHFWGGNGHAAINGAKNYAYLSYASKMDHTMSYPIDYPSNNKQHFGKGDIIIVHLDLDERTIGFSRNGKYLGIAFENIEQASYRLAFSCKTYRKTKHVIKLLQ